MCSTTQHVQAIVSRLLILRHVTWPRFVCFKLQNTVWIPHEATCLSMTWTYDPEIRLKASNGDSGWTCENPMLGWSVWCSELVPWCLDRGPKVLMICRKTPWTLWQIARLLERRHGVWNVETREPPKALRWDPKELRNPIRILKDASATGWKEYWLFSWDFVDWQPTFYTWSELLIKWEILRVQFDGNASSILILYIWRNLINAKKWYRYLRNINIPNIRSFIQILARTKFPI